MSSEKKVPFFNKGKKRNDEINKMLADSKKEMRKTVNLLLLGTGESGKSTFAKQMKILHLGGFSEDERLDYKPVIFKNVIDSIKNLINAAKHFGYSIENEEEAEEALKFDYKLEKKEAEIIAKLWKDKGIQTAYENKNKFQLNDSAQYYFDKIDELGKPDYIPTEEDVLRTRAKTSGIVETGFKYDDITYRMLDVGGQKSERKKWMRCFEDVTAIIYFVGLSEYDMTLREDDTTNRMLDSIQTFKDTVNLDFFKKTAIILCLNKRDLFEEKIKKVDMSVCFPDYTGGPDFDKAIEYITNVFQKQAPNKTMYTQVSCATDTENTKRVFNFIVKDIILSKLLYDVGMNLY